MENNNALVSIVLPTYNTKESYLNDIIESIDNLTYDNFELIIIDDASTNVEHLKRLNQLEKEVKKYPLYIYYQKINTGPAGAYNIGISYASGSYIKTCGHDDYLPKESLKKHVLFMEDNKGFDIVLGDIEVFGMVNDKWPGLYGYGTTVKKDLTDLTFEKLFTGKVMMLGPCALVRKKVYDEIGNYDVNVGVEDWDFLLRALDHNISFGYIEKVIYRQRKHEVNLSKNALYMVLSRYIVIKKYQIRIDLYQEVSMHYKSTLEQLMSLSKKDFWNTFTSIAQDKELGYMYLPKLFLKYPTLLPSLVFRLLVNPNAKVFKVLKERLHKSD